MNTANTMQKAKTQIKIMNLAMANAWHSNGQRAKLMQAFVEMRPVPLTEIYIYMELALEGFS